jgi:fused signal recognition particle receptor
VREWLDRIKGALSRTKKAHFERVISILSNRVMDRGVMDEIEEILILADVGVETTSRLIESIKGEKGEPLSILKEKISSILSREDPTLRMAPHPPTVIMVIGVNGVGKTLTLAKLSYRFKQEGRDVMLVCGDTFRAAATDQLRAWSERIGVEMVAQSVGGDPSAVVYDALEAAKARRKEIVMIDTAGRLHTKKNLIEELKKIKRICAKRVEGAPHEILFVLDATFGQNGLLQAGVFSRELGITGVVLSKLDGSSKGGVIIGIVERLGIPIKFIGIGEGLEDLAPFDGRRFAELLLSP